MSIRHAMLALLQEQPMHGYQLRQEFETRTGGTWPLNIGQAYTTLQRLQRDGLVEPVPDAEGEPERFRLTAAGREQAGSWWSTPVERGAPARDELAIKLALAVTLPGVDVDAVVRTQRTETMRSLQDYARLKRRIPADVAGADLAWSLVLDSLVFQAEAEMRWLDHVEGRVLAQRRSPRPPDDAATTHPTPSSSATEDAPAGTTRHRKARR